MVKLGGSGSFRVSGGVVGRLGFRVGVSASYSYFRRVRNFDFMYTAAVSVPLVLVQSYVSDSTVCKLQQRIICTFADVLMADTS